MTLQLLSRQPPFTNVSTVIEKITSLHYRSLFEEYTNYKKKNFLVFRPASQTQLLIKDVGNLTP